MNKERTEKFEQFIAQLRNELGLPELEELIADLRNELGLPELEDRIAALEIIIRPGILKETSGDDG